LEHFSLFIDIFAKRMDSMGTEILRIIEGGLSNDIRKIVSYSNRLANRLESEGDISMAKCIREKIDLASKSSNISPDALRILPVDQDSRLQIVEVVPSDERRQKIVLSSSVERQVEEFISLVNNSSKLELAGVMIPKSMLLYGQPGCGKTSIAHYVSEKTGLPLIVARLDGIVSSLLGSTAKNLRKIFDYASSIPCILFLDEFDAIAKARDDAHELGELKRVINSLLQNIDTFPNGCVLIAATNHPDLLDKAVWRRFTQKVEVGLPSISEIMEMIDVFSEPFDMDILKDNTRKRAFAKTVKDLSPSDIKTAFDRAKAQAVLKNEKSISVTKLLESVFEFKEAAERREFSEEDLIRFLRNNGATISEINKDLGISLRRIKEFGPHRKQED